MIVTNYHLQMMRCDICHGEHAIPRWMLRDPFQAAQMRERLSASHKSCEQYRGRPGLAAANRKFERAMRREQARRAAAA